MAHARHAATRFPALALGETPPPTSSPGRRSPSRTWRTLGGSNATLKANDIAYEVIESKYEDYGAAIAEGVAVGSVRVYSSPAGRIYGARILGEGAGEMINEWGLAIQNRLRLHRILFLQHSFPSMSFLSKRTAESRMMNRMKDPLLRKLVRPFV